MEISECQPNEFGEIINLMESEHLATKHMAPEYLEGFLRARDDSKNMLGVIGSQWYPPYGIVTSLAVDHHFERPKIARELNKHIETWFSEHGVDELYILSHSDIELMALGYDPVDEADVPNVVFDCLHFPDFDCQKPIHLGKKQLVV